MSSIITTEEIIKFINEVDNNVKILELEGEFYFLTQYATPTSNTVGSVDYFSATAILATGFLISVCNIDNVNLKVERYLKLISESSKIKLLFSGYKYKVFSK